MFVEIAASNFDCKDSVFFIIESIYSLFFKINNYEYSD